MSHLIFKSSAVALSLMVAQSAYAATYLADFNTINGGAHPGGAPAWNIYVSPGNVDGSVIKDTSGSTAAGVTLQNGDIDGNNKANDSGTNAGANAAVAGPAWATNGTTSPDTAAIGDYFFTNTAGGAQNFQMTFGGLTAGDTATLDVVTARDFSGQRAFWDYSLDGGTTWTGFNVFESDGTAATTDGWDTNDTTTQIFFGREDGFDKGRYASASFTLLDSSLILRTTDTDNDGRNWASVSALRLATEAAGEVPEPASVAMLGLGAIAMLTRRRK